MGLDPRDQEVIGQLRKLRDVDKEYPPELLAARRHLFLKRIGEMSLGIGMGEGIQQALKTPKTPLTSPLTSKLLETVLVIAIIAEAGTVAYLYRDKLSEALKTFVASAEIQEIISPPVIASPISLFTTALNTASPELTLTPEAGYTSTPALSIVSQTPGTVTPTQTPIPDLVDSTSSVNPTAIQSNSTPNPNGNNGNHYGQTPKPERTKENNGNGSGNGNGGGSEDGDRGGNGNGNGGGNGNGNNNRP